MKRSQSLPSEQPAAKRIHTEEYDKAMANMHSLAQAVTSSSVQHDYMLASALSLISQHAPPEACIRHIVPKEAEELIKQNPDDLKAVLERAIREGDYAQLLSTPILKRGNVLGAGSDRPKPASKVRSTDKRKFAAVVKAFTAPYVAGFPEAFLKAVDTYSLQESYNNAVAIVQSSGTGKSRGVAEVAKLRFTFLFNIRRRLKDTQYSYPPPDDCIRDYLVSQGKGPSERRYTAFLCSLFTLAPKYILGIDRKGVPLAAWWYHVMNDGGDEHRPGVKRAEFYKEVVEGAENALRQEGDILSHLQVSCETLVGILQREYLRDDPQATPPVTPCLLVFDDAQELAYCPGGEDRPRYQNLGSVLNEISRRVFSVFVSTNSDVRDLAPSEELHSSLRVNLNPKPLHPPFTELPFDVFAMNLNDKLRGAGRSTLEQICAVDVMSCFGRTLWHSLYENGRNQSSIVPLAMDKLCPTRHFADDELAQFTCLAIRIGLDFDASREIGVQTELKAVESYMRIVFAAPAHREFMRTGTPSEPILAEAAARLLNGVTGVPNMTFGELAPKVLSVALQRGVLARGERGKMVGRLLWTMAHDRAVQKTTDTIVYHRPIRVIHFLHCLFPATHWNAIDNATPIGDDMGPPLSEAFKDAYVCFSHFMDAVGHDIDLHMAYQLLLRGAALSYKRSEASIDFLAPIHFGSPDSTISSSTTSVLQAGVKNRNQPEEVYVNPELVQTALPVLSLVHELGSSDNSVASSPFCGTSQQLHSRHYKIVSHGCSSSTFAVIPAHMDDLYIQLLGSEPFMEDYPRAGIPECASLFRQLNPCCWTKPSQQGRIRSWFGEHVN